MPSRLHTLLRMCPATPCFAAGMFALALGALAMPLAGQPRTQPIAARDSAIMRSGPVLTGIAVFGNKATNQEIITREITIAVGDRITPGEVEFSQARIYSLGLFNSVRIQYPPLDSTVLIVEVNERMHFFPVPIIGIVNKDIHRWQVGAGLLHNNFRGWNEKVWAAFAMGNDPWAEVSYTNPWIFGGAQMYSDTRLRYQNQLTKNIIASDHDHDENETRYSISQMIGKRLNLYNSVDLTLSWQHVETARELRGLAISPAGTDQYPSLAVGYKMDSRNLIEYPTAGTYIQTSVQANGLGLTNVEFYAWSFDARHYHPVTDDVALCVRAFTRIASGPSMPAYEHGFFGYNERMRGNFDTVMEGENIGGGSVELRVPIIRPFYLSVPQVPIPEFSLWRLGLYAAAFIDGGTVWNRDENPFRGRVPFGYGGGLHVLLPYGFVVRLEYARNELDRGQAIAGIGASF